jgi:Flp pilus assembly protein TadG
MSLHRPSRAGLCGPRRAGRAQALAEFALVVPIFFLILFGIIDFGRYVYYTQILNNAAREGARYAIVHGELGTPKTGPPSDPSGTAVINVVRNYAIGVVGLQDATVLDIDASWDPANNKRGTKVTVVVTYDFHSVIPLVPIPPITVRGASTLVINN